MKHLSSIMLDSMIMPIYFFSTTTLALPAATPVTAGKLQCAHPVSMKDRPVYLTSTDRRMCQYRSPDAPVQITGCASTDRRMRQYRSPDAPVQITGCTIFGPEMLPEALWRKRRKVSTTSANQT